MEKSCVKQNNINLKLAIYHSDLSMAEIARRIGCHRSTIANWFNSNHFPKDEHLQKLLPVLNEIQNKKGEIPYTLSYLRGDTKCKKLTNEDIYNRIYLKDEAIATLEKVGKKDTNKATLVEDTCPITRINTFNYFIEQDKLWEILYKELRKTLSDNRKDIMSKYNEDKSVQNCLKNIEQLDIPISNEISDIIKTIINNYIKESLRTYFPEK